MNEYEIVGTYLNGCAGEAYPQRWFEEAELNDPADYIRKKHGRDFDKFTREQTPTGQIIYRWAGPAVTYIYEFTQV